MKTFAEQVADLKATRLAKADEMKSVAQKSVDAGRSMDSAEQEQFDTLHGEVKSLDSDIGRLSTLADMDVATAKAVDDSASRKSVTAERLPVQVKHTEKLEPGIGFARIARVKAMSKEHQTPMLQMAQALYPNDEELVKSVHSKAAVPGANASNAPWAGNLILDNGAYFADFVEYLRARSVIGQISGSLRALPFDTRVMVQTAAATGFWVGEGAAKNVTQAAYTNTKLEPLKVAAIAVATKEMIARASTAVDTLIRDELARACIAAIDGTFVSAVAAAPGVSPAGILNGTSATVVVGTGDADGIRMDATRMMQAMVSDSKSLQGTFWLMPESIAVALSTMTTALGVPAYPTMTPVGGTFMGLPVFVSQYLPTVTAGATVMLIKGDDIFLGDEGGIQVSMSDQASILMADNASASMNSTTPTGSANLVSMFQTNSVAFLVERHINWAKRRANAVVWAQVNWGAA